MTNLKSQEIFSFEDTILFSESDNDSDSDSYNIPSENESKLFELPNPIVKHSKKVKYQNEIPLEFIGYNIIIKTNICVYDLKDLSVVKFIKNHISKRIISNVKKEISFEFDFSVNEQHIFNRLLDASDCDIEEITNNLLMASNFFDEYEVSRKMQNRIDKYIVSNYQSDRIWKALTSKPDYNLCLFKNRTFPYFHLECKDWVKSNLNALKDDYPSELMRDVNIKKKSIDGFGAELNMAAHNNNFLEWGVLPVDQYPNMDKLVNRIIIFYQLGLKRQSLTLFLRLMLSPRECHICKEPKIWELFNSDMKSNSHIEEIIRYCFYFAMYILRHEETVMFSQVNDNYRVLFTLEEACALPPFHNAHIERNPYILQLTNNMRLSDSIPFYLHGKRYINNKKEFDRRFALATGNAFKGINLLLLGAAITGSILIPCVHKSPLEKGFDNVDWIRDRSTIDVNFPFMVDTPENSDDFAFLNYLEYYYPSYVSLTDADYINQVLGSNSIPLFQQPDEISYETDDIDDHQSDINKSNINKSTNYIIETPEEEHKHKRPVIGNNQLSDIDISITARNFDIFKVNALKLYEQIKANCEHRGDVYIKEIKTLSSVKFKIYGPGIPRPMDIFRIPYDPVKMIKKFHLHCVKMYYNGNDVIMFRSCVSCLLSGVNESYKWFSCNKIPKLVTLRYAARGFSLIENSKEKEASINYLNNDNTWGQLLKFLKIPVKRMYCCVTEDHPFFQSGLADCGIRLNLRKFEREFNSQYSSSLVVSYPRTDFPYGELLIKDNNKQHPPNAQFIHACLDYVETETDVVKDT
jgi:hypothetical protein